MEEAVIPSLRPYQQELVQNLRVSLGKNDSVVCCLPAGGGKTRLAKYMIGKAIARKTDRISGKCLFVVYGRNLVDNARDSFNESPTLPHGVIMSREETDWANDVYIASIDTVLSWYVENGSYKPEMMTFDLIIFDEAHVHCPKMIKLQNAHNAARKERGQRASKLVGLSATPKAKQLAELFNCIVQGPETQWMIDEGYLVPFEYFGATQGNTNLLVKDNASPTGFNRDSITAAMKGLSGNMVRDWLEYGEGRQTVGFFNRRTEAMDAMKAFNDAGVAAEYVDGETPDDKRRKLFRWLGDGTIKYLCNVNVVSRGTNIPEISCIQLCTCIRNIADYIQKLGRGSRTAPNKTNCIVIDHGGNVHGRNDSLGFFEDHVQWQLEFTNDKTADGEGRPTIKCPQCDRVYRGGNCSVCGYAPQARELKAQGLQFNGAKLEKIEKASRKESTGIEPMDRILVSALYQAGKRNGTWKQAVAIAYSKANKQGQKFKFPSTFVVAGKTYRPIPYGSPDGNRRVRDLFDFIKRKYGGSA